MRRLAAFLLAAFAAVPCLQAQVPVQPLAPGHYQAPANPPALRPRGAQAAPPRAGDAAARELSISTQAVRQLRELGFTEEQLAEVSAVARIIQERYVEDVDSQRLLDGALRGMLRELDPHSQYFTAQEYAEFQARLSGAPYAGIGVLHNQKAVGEGLRVELTAQRGPAAGAGVLVGDVIVSVDGDSTLPMTTEQAHERLLGRPGTTVRLGIQRAGQASSLELTVTRAYVRVNEVHAQLLPGRVGYVRISQFSDESDDLFIPALLPLHRQGMRGLVIDVRGNPGGSLDAVRRIASVFLAHNQAVLQVQGRDGRRRPILPMFSGPYPALPLAVLIDEGSASASEILAGALQDHGRAKVFGGKSYGKGTVQIVIPFRDGSAMKLTIQRYFTPNGNQVDGRGIQPDRPVQPTEAEARAAAEALHRTLFGGNVDEAGDPVLRAAAEELRR